jgi:hypothetical protein
MTVRLGSMLAAAVFVTAVIIARPAAAQVMATGHGNYKVLGTLPDSTSRIGVTRVSQRNVILTVLQLDVRRGISVSREPYDSLVTAINSVLEGSDRLLVLDDDSLQYGLDLKSRQWLGPNAAYGVDCEHGQRYEQPQVGLKRVTANFRQRAIAFAKEHDLDFLLLMTVEPTYYVADGPRVGRRHLNVGTQHRHRLPLGVSKGDCWGVVQVAAILMNRDGEVVRIGAEGIIAAGSALARGGALAGLFPDFSVQEIEARATSATRDDLPGSPPAWQVAVHQLLMQVTGRLVPSS